MRKQGHSAGCCPFKILGCEGRDTEKDKIRSSHGLYGKVLGRRDAAALSGVSFFGCVAAGLWRRRVFNLNTSVSQKQTAA